MQLSEGQLTSPVEGWGEDLHRLLEERAAQAGYTDADGNVDESSLAQDFTSNAPHHTPSRSRIESRSNSSAVRVSRALPARSDVDRFPSIASAFDIYVAPDLPPSTAAASSGQDAQKLRNQLNIEPSPASRPFVLATSAEQPVNSDFLGQDDPPGTEAVHPGLLGESFVNRISPEGVRDDLAGESDSKLHPAMSMVSISSEDTWELGSTSEPNGTGYEESTRSFQLTPPTSNAHSPPLSPRQPSLSINYTRPMAPEGIPNQTPLVEVGPSWSGTEASNSPQPPYRISIPVQSSLQSPISPTKRRTHSYYAFVDARSDRILNLPQQPPIESSLPNPDQAPKSPTTLPQKNSRSLALSASPASHPYREAEPAASFIIESEDADISAFAPRRQSTVAIASDQPYYILPEDHTDRIRQSTDQNPAPVRRKPVSKPAPLPKKSVTDTFKEAVSDLASSHDSLKEVDASPSRPRHLSDSSYRSFYSDKDIPAEPASANYRAISSSQDGRQRFADGENEIIAAPTDMSRRSVSSTSQQGTYVDTSKETVARAPTGPKPVRNVQAAPIAEPRSHLEMIRQRNMERKRGKRNELRIVNM